MWSLDIEEREFHPGTFTSRPRKFSVVCSGDFCCIALCKSSTLDRDRNKSGIGFFFFPSDSTIRKRWVEVICQFCRKCVNDSFSIKNQQKFADFTSLLIALQ